MVSATETSVSLQQVQSVIDEQGGGGDELLLTCPAYQNKSLVQKLTEGQDLDVLCRFCTSCSLVLILIIFVNFICSVVENGQCSYFESSVFRPFPSRVHWPVDVQLRSLLKHSD